MSDDSRMSAVKQIEKGDSEEEDDSESDVDSEDEEETIARIQRAHYAQTLAMNARRRAPARSRPMSNKRKLEAVRSFHDFSKRLKQDTGIKIRGLVGNSILDMSDSSEESDSSDGLSEKEFEVNPDAVEELNQENESYIDPFTGDIVTGKQPEQKPQKSPSPPPEPNNPEPVEQKTLSISDIINDGDLDLTKNVEIAEVEGSELCPEKPDELFDIKPEENSQDYDITEKLKEMGEISVKPVNTAEEEEEKSEENKEEEEEKKPANPNALNVRRNIREVMDEKNLDASTLTAQRQESERLARVQEQQRIIREVQRQIAMNRQNKTHQKALSLLQGGSSILKKSVPGQKIGIANSNTVLVKLPSGEVKRTVLKPDMSKVAKPPAQKTDKKDVVEIVSSSSGSETSSSSSDSDDCIMLSDSEVPPSPEAEDDPNNSGLHVNDTYNIPDEQGRVLINIGHPENEEDIFLAPQIARVIKPHQIGGVRFLFDNIIESVERFSTSTGFGCILAHSMGLGKTLQIVCFCDIFLRHTKSKTVLCIMPINTLQNWVAEFNMWLPTDPTNSPLAAHGEVRPRNFPIYVLNDSHKTLQMRAKVVKDWTTTGGVLMIGYELFRLLSMKKDKKPRRKKKTEAEKEKEKEEKKAEKEKPNDANNEDTQGSDITNQSKLSDESKLDKDDEMKTEAEPKDDEKKGDATTDEDKKLLDEMYEALVKPGPDLVICDEGHRIKNSHSNISYALKQMRTKRRVVLTGYPLQNNLLEYWCMVDFVRPNYLGSKTEFCNMFERPIQNGQCIDSTPQDIRLMRYRAHVLHSLLVGFVQRRSHAVLQSTLPQKAEYVLLIRLTPLQRKLYDQFMNEVVRTTAVPNPLKAFAICCKIWNHPDVLYNFLRKRSEASMVVEEDLDLEEIGGVTKANRGRATRATARRPAKPRGSAKKPAATIPPNTSGGPPRPDNAYGPYPQQGAYPPQQGGYPPYNYPPNQPGFYPPNQPYNQNYGPNYYPQQPPYNYPNQYPQNSQEGYNQNYWGNGNYYENQGYYNNPQYPANQPPVGDYPNGQAPTEYPSGQSAPTEYPNNLPPASGYPNSQPPQSAFPPNQTVPPQYPSDQPPTASSPYPSNPQPPASSQYPSNQQPPNQYPSGDQSQYPSAQTPAAPYSSQPTTPGYNNPQYPANYNAQPDASNYTANTSQEYPNQSFDQKPSQYPNTYQNPPPNYDYNNPPPEGYQQQYPYGTAPYPQNSTNYNQDYPNYPANVPPNALPDNVPNQPKTEPNTNDIKSEPLASQPYVNAGYNYPDQPENANGEYPPTYPFPAHLEIKQPLSSGGSGSPITAWPITELKTEVDKLKAEEKAEIKSESDGEVKIEDLDTKKIVGEENKPVKPELLKESKDTKKESQSKNHNSKSKAKDKSDESATEDGPKKKGRGKKTKADKPDKPKPRARPRAKGRKDRKTSKEKNDKESDSESEKEEKMNREEELAMVRKAEEMTYDWATELLKDYVPGIIENSAKMTLFFYILNESIKLGDRLLLFSQSLFTLNLIEDFLQKNYVPGTPYLWAKNVNYYRLDGSTHALEREKLINEFNANPHVHLFLVSTRAGSLGINLVGANRVIVFDSSWNPCHDTQAVCRVYRYGQKKPCFVYRFVMDWCLEKKIYDRQINKQGMADRVVDECNPDAVLSMKEITNLCFDNDEKESEPKDLSGYKDKYIDVLMQGILEHYGKFLSKEPFQHESLLVDRKEKKLSSAEKRLAQRGYELEKKAALAPKPSLAYRTVRCADGSIIQRPVASVRPMQHAARWIPADVWRRQGMTAQEMTLPLDVVIPTNSAEKTNIVLKAGQRVMVLKSPKGIYMQLESGKIIAIKTAMKGLGQKAGDGKDMVPKKVIGARPSPAALPGSLKNNSAITITSKSGIRPGMQRVISRPVMGQRIRPVIPGQKIAEIRQRLGEMKSIPIGSRPKLPLAGGRIMRPNIPGSVSITKISKEVKKQNDDKTNSDAELLDSDDEASDNRKKVVEPADKVTSDRTDKTTGEGDQSKGQSSSGQDTDKEADKRQQSNENSLQRKNKQEKKPQSQIENKPIEQKPIVLTTDETLPSEEALDTQSKNETLSKNDTSSKNETFSKNEIPSISAALANSKTSRKKVTPDEIKTFGYSERLENTRPEPKLTPEVVEKKVNPLKNYRHQRLIGRPAASESSLSQLEKTASTLNTEGMPAFRKNLDDITQSYVPGEEKPASKSRRKKAPSKVDVSSERVMSPGSSSPSNPLKAKNESQVTANVPPMGLSPSGSLPHAAKPDLDPSKMPGPAAGMPGMPGQSYPPSNPQAEGPYGQYPGYSMGYGGYPNAPYYGGYGAPHYYPPNAAPPPGYPPPYPPNTSPAPEGYLPPNPQW